MDACPELAGRYTNWQKLGEGGFGTVYKVGRRSDEKPFAIKLLSIGQDPEEMGHFLREGELLSQLNHPNIVAVEEVCQDPTDGQPYIVMEYCDGGDLRQAINLRKSLKTKMTEGPVLRIFIQIVLGLHFCHTSTVGKQRILHRDLKPENVLITSDGTFKIADFGLSRILEAREEVAHSIVGTPGYLPPEMKEGRSYDVKADMYSLGCILYEISTLRKMPLKQRTVDRICAAPLEGYSSAFSNMQARLLSRDPQQRPSTSELLALPCFAQLLGESMDVSYRKLREFDEKVSALDVRQKCIDDMERDLKHRITELKRQERILHVLKEDHLSAVRRYIRKSMSPEPENTEKASIC